MSSYDIASQIEDSNHEQSDDVKRGAALVACSFAESPEEARMLLDMLGLSDSLIGENL